MEFNHILQKTYRNHDSGQGLAEYALLLALTGVVLIAGLAAFGPSDWSELPPNH